MERRSFIQNAAIFSAAFAAAPIVEAALTETPTLKKLPEYQVRRACHVVRMDTTLFGAEEFKTFMRNSTNRMTLCKTYSDPRAPWDCAVYLDVPHYTRMVHLPFPQVESEPLLALDGPLRWVVVPTQSEFQYRGIEFRFWDRDLFEQRYLEPDFFL